MQSKTIAAHLAAPGRSRVWTLQRREALAGVLFALPAMLGFVVWWLGPMLASALISFTDWDILSSPRWTGLANYFGTITPTHPIPGLIYDPLFWKSMEVTAYYTALAVPASLVVGFLIAFALSHPLRLVGLLRSVYYLPSILPAVTTALTWLWLYNPQYGLLDSALAWAGLPTSPFLTDESTVVPSLALMNVWGCGGLMVIFLAAIKGIDRTLYEAAAIDGANALRRLWHITLPGVSPIILFNLITSIIGTFSGGIVQGQFMTNGGPDNGSLFYGLYLYRTAFQDGNMGYATAMGWVMMLLLMILTLLILGVARSRVYYEDVGVR